MMTGKRVSTLTPESSEAPRESVAGAKRAWFDESPELKPEHLDVVLGRKTRSPELASLAAKYIDFDARDGMAEAVIAGDGERLRQITKDVRALAASVLAQAEGTPRK